MGDLVIREGEVYLCQEGDGCVRYLDDPGARARMASVAADGLSWLHGASYDGVLVSELAPSPNCHARLQQIAYDSEASTSATSITCYRSAQELMESAAIWHYAPDPDLYEYGLAVTMGAPLAAMGIAGLTVGGGITTAGAWLMAQGATTVSWLGGSLWQWNAARAAIGASLGLGLEITIQAGHSFFSPKTYEFQPLRFLWAPLMGVLLAGFGPMVRLGEWASGLMAQGILRNLGPLAAQLIPLAAFISGADAMIYNFIPWMRGKITDQEYAYRIAFAMGIGGVAGLALPVALHGLIRSISPILRPPEERLATAGEYWGLTEIGDTSPASLPDHVSAMASRGGRGQGLLRWLRGLRGERQNPPEPPATRPTTVVRSPAPGTKTITIELSGTPDARKQTLTRAFLGMDTRAGSSLLAKARLEEHTANETVTAVSLRLADDAQGRAIIVCFHRNQAAEPSASKIHVINIPPGVRTFDFYRNGVFDEQAGFTWKDPVVVNGPEAPEVARAASVRLGSAVLGSKIFKIENLTGAAYAKQVKLLEIVIKIDGAAHRNALVKQLDLTQSMDEVASISLRLIDDASGKRIAIALHSAADAGNDSVTAFQDIPLDGDEFLSYLGNVFNKDPLEFMMPARTSVPPPIPDDATRVGELTVLVDESPPFEEAELLGSDPDIEILLDFNPPPAASATRTTNLSGGRNRVFFSIEPEPEGSGSVKAASSGSGARTPSGGHGATISKDPVPYAETASETVTVHLRSGGVTDGRVTLRLKPMGNPNFRKGQSGEPKIVYHIRDERGFTYVVAISGKDRQAVEQAAEALQSRATSRGEVVFTETDGIVTAELMGIVFAKLRDFKDALSYVFTPSTSP